MQKCAKGLSPSTEDLLNSAIVLAQAVYANKTIADSEKVAFIQKTLKAALVEAKIEGDTLATLNMLVDTVVPSLLEHAMKKRGPSAFTSVINLLCCRGSSVADPTPAVSVPSAPVASVPVDATATATSTAAATTAVAVAVPTATVPLPVPAPAPSAPVSAPVPPPLPEAAPEVASVNPPA